MARVFFTVAILLACGNHACPAEDKPAKKADAPTEVEIRALVDSLVSSNAQPKEVFRSLPGQKADDKSKLDQNEQNRVGDVYHKLRDIGSAVLPHLIERFDDPRYALTVEHGLSGEAYNWSVGDVCRDVFVAHVHPFGPYSVSDDGGDPRSRPYRPRYPLPNSKAEAEKWWAKNKEKSLQRIQLDVLEWIIAEEAKPLEDGRKYPEAEGRQLRKWRTELVESGRPFPPGAYSVCSVVRDFRKMTRNK